MTAVDVVVVSYNSSQALRGCVEPLSHEDWINVVVVDNASSDGSLESIDDLSVTRIELRSNGGFAHGCNVGWRAGASEYILLLNPDARIDRDSVQTLTRIMDSDPQVGLVGPRITDERGNLEFSIRRFPRLVSTYGQALFLHRIWPNATWADEIVITPTAYDAPAAVEWLSGACLLVRRSLLEQLGGLDESFFMYCEDIDLCRRVTDMGFRVEFDPGANCTHLGGGGASMPRAALLPVLAASRVRYAKKHRDAATATLERAGVALSSLTHAAIGRGEVGTRAGHARAFVTALTAS